MPEPNQPAQEPLRPFRPELLGFKNAVKPLLVADADNVPLQQYLSLRDKVFQIVEDPKFLDAMDKAWNELSAENDDVRSAMLEELNAFPRAVESANAEEKKNPTASWRSALLSWASTTVGSLKKLLAKAPWYVQSGLTLFKEVIDIFRKK
jgi:hypothetical protein